MIPFRIIFVLVLFSLIESKEALAAPLSDEQMLALLKKVDDRQRNNGDYKTIAYVQQKEKDKNDRVFQMVIYRRDEDDKLILLFLKPKSEAGKGYLRLDKNLFLYDPSTGNGTAEPSANELVEPIRDGQTLTSRALQKSTHLPILLKRSLENSRFIG